MRIKYRLPKIDLAGLHRVIKHFGSHLKPHRTKLLLSVLALLGMSTMTLLRPWPLKLIFDYVLLPGKGASRISFLESLAQWDPLSVVFLAAAAVLTIAVLNGFLSYSQGLLTKTVGHKVTAAIRLQLFSHIQRLPQSYHDYRQTGDLITRLTGDINLLQDLLVETIIRLTGQLAIILGMLTVAFVIDWQLALLILAVMPFFLLASLRFSRRIKKAAGHQREKYGKLVSSMEETLAGISQVKVFSQEKQRDKVIGKSVSQDFKAGLKTTKLAANYSRIVELIAAFGTALVLFLGARKALAGAISPGDLIIFLWYLRGIYRPIQSVAKLSAKIAKATVRGEKIMEILEMQPEVKDREGATSARNIRGDIKFSDVDFSYVNTDYVLHKMSCTIPSKKITVLIGPTGAGKSTIAKLLLRLYDSSEGSIILDGKDIADYKTKSLRKRVTSLTQEAFLFRTSIRDNIAFGKPWADQEEIEQAAKLVGADEFIRKLPTGYDSMVGEGGFTLSGGQRQRISFARAALRNSPIMIFDEPATGLDIHAEKEAKAALRVLRLRRTILIITHRLNFLELADWAIYIRDGHLMEEGIPEELLDRKRSFYDFVSQEINKTGDSKKPDSFLPSKSQEL